MSIRVLIVDDHTLFREGFTKLLSNTADIEIVGEAGNGFDAVAKVHELKPDVVLMDLYMPGLDGTEAIRLITRDAPGTACILLTASAEEANVMEAIQAGAKGYLVKNSSGSAILNHIRQVAKGSVALSDDSVSKLMAGLAMDRRPARHADIGPYETISHRETEVLELVSKGMANKEIAGILNISEHTARAHVRSLMQKLNADNRTQLAIYGVREGVGWKPTAVG
ncbi:MAG: response regulator transcription factor [Dehalococcoidia bacterium]